MSVTPSFSLSLKALAIFGVVGSLTVLRETAQSQAVPSQANIDASAQRRMQEMAEESRRRQRIEDQIRLISPALASEKLAGPRGPVLARQVLAALIRLRQEGITVNEALSRAVREARLDAAQTAKSTAYFRNLFSELSGKITSTTLKQLEAGEDPAPTLIIPLFQP
jgi:hypothetical protein